MSGAWGRFINPRRHGADNPYQEKGKIMTEENSQINDVKIDAVQSITLTHEQVWFNAVLQGHHFFGTVEQSCRFADEILKEFKARFK